MQKRCLIFNRLLIMLVITFKSMAGSFPTDKVYISGYTVVNEEALKVIYFDKQRNLYVPEKAKVKMRLFGKFTSETYLKLSTSINCGNKGSSEEKRLNLIGNDETAAEAEVTFPDAMKEHSPAYFCLREGSSALSVLQGKYISAGKLLVHEWLTVKLIRKDRISLWIRIFAVAVLLSLSALFSGLNLGLLSLDKTDLKVIVNTGSQKERSEALKIAPVRNHGNYLLCSLLFSNVLVNTILTLVMDEVFSGGDGETVIVTTLAVVIVGEILPQAVCSRYGLTVGAKTIYITKFFMTISFPVAYPVGKFLDKMLGEEVGAVYTRDRLKELLKVTKDQHGLESQEMGIISGTLDMKTKTVKDVMTPLDNIFMVSYTAILNVDLLVDIEDSGFTRIPVYQDERWNVVGVLNVKHLTLYDPGQNLPVKKQVDNNKANLFFVFENTRLDYMLKAFREGSKGHMAFVQKINDEGPDDPKYETIGLVTLEDVLEAILQVEIYDEDDVEKLQGKVSAAHAIPLPLVSYTNTSVGNDSSKRGTIY